jgi:hypothetical protein
MKELLEILQQSNNNIIDLPNPVAQRKKFKISEEEKKDLKSMLKWIPPIEQQFLKNIIYVNKYLLL